MTVWLDLDRFPDGWDAVTGGLWLERRSSGITLHTGANLEAGIEGYVKLHSGQKVPTRWRCCVRGT